MASIAKSSSTQTFPSVMPVVVVFVVQSLSHVWLFVTSYTAARQASLSFTISWSLLKLMSIELMMLSNHLIPCCPIFLLPSIFPCIRVFSNESALHIRWPKYWSFSFNISPSNEYPGLISFRINWIDFLVVQGTLKSLLQNYSLKASIFMFRDLCNNDNKKEFLSTAFLKANSQTMEKVYLWERLLPPWSFWN